MVSAGFGAGFIVCLAIAAFASSQPRLVTFEALFEPCLLFRGKDRLDGFAGAEEFLFGSGEVFIRDGLHAGLTTEENGSDFVALGEAQGEVLGHAAADTADLLF